MSVQKDTKADNKNLKKRIILILMIVMLLLTIAGIIFIYIKLNDKNRNPNKIDDYEISEIIKKNYIDGFNDIESDGVFTFSLNKDDINELLDKSVEGLNNKRIKSIYYDVGNDNHHYFYVDLKKTGIKTRIVVDTLLEVDNSNKCYYFAIQDCTIGKSPAFSLLQKKRYFSEDFFSKIREYSNLPISYLEEYNRIKYEPLKYMEQFPYGDVSGLIFDFVKEVPTTISLDSSNIGFKVDFTKFRNTDYTPDAETTDVVDVYQRVKEALEATTYSTLPLGEPYTVASLSDKELTAILNDSFIGVNDDEVKSTLTFNTANFSINKINVKFIDDVTLRYVYDVSVNGYVCNINQDAEVSYDIYDFATSYFTKIEIESGGVKFSGSSNKHVTELLNISDDLFTDVKTKQPKAFNSNSLVSRFDINLAGISSELSDSNMQSVPKETTIDSINKRINFAVTRMF